MWIDVASLPSTGKEFEFSDQSIWMDPIRKFKLECRITSPIQAVVSVIPQMGNDVDGCLIRGHLKGEIAVPCNRCAEDAYVAIDTDFDSFEPFPSDAIGVGNPETDDLVVRLSNGKPEINLEGLIWEEFSMAIPVKPLCRQDCKGLCPICGMNRNIGSCLCTDDTGDPRLAMLRGLKVRK